MVNELMRAEVEAVHLTYIDILGTECRDGTCMLFAPDGVPIKFDYGHLTFSGARFIIEANRDKFSERRQSAPNEGGQLPF